MWVLEVFFVRPYFLILQIGKNGVTGVNVANHVVVAFNPECEHVIQVKMDKHAQVQPWLEEFVTQPPAIVS